MATLIGGSLMAFGLWYSFAKMDAEDGRMAAILIAALLLFSWFIHLGQLSNLERRCGMERTSYFGDDYGE
jgi:hypothetical protein